MQRRLLSAAALALVASLGHAALVPDALALRLCRNYGSRALRIVESCSRLDDLGVPGELTAPAFTEAIERQGGTGKAAADNAERLSKAMDSLGGRYDAATAKANELARAEKLHQDVLMAGLTPTEGLTRALEKLRRALAEKFPNSAASVYAG